MANALYPLWKQELMKGTSGTSLNEGTGSTLGVFAVLVDLGTYTYNASHQFYSSLSGIVGTESELLTKTFNTPSVGVFDAADTVFTAVTGTTAEAIVIYRRTSGANTTWPLIAFIDSATSGLPATPNGGNITITWSASGILAL